MTLPKVASDASRSYASVARSSGSTASTTGAISFAARSGTTSRGERFGRVRLLPLVSPAQHRARDRDPLGHDREHRQLRSRAGQRTDQDDPAFRRGGADVDLDVATADEVERDVDFGPGCLEDRGDGGGDVEIAVGRRAARSRRRGRAGERVRACPACARYLRHAFRARGRAGCSRCRHHSPRRGRASTRRRDPTRASPARRGR